MHRLVTYVTCTSRLQNSIRLQYKLLRNTSNARIHQYIQGGPKSKQLPNYQRIVLNCIQHNFQHKICQ